MIKIAICKIPMCGSPALILGVGRRFEEGDEHWAKYQAYTREDYLNCEYKYNPDAEWCVYKSQEQADRESEKMREMALTFSRFQGDTFHFKHLNKDVPVYRSPHNFRFKDAPLVEISKEELDLLNQDIREDWEGFDWETWGK